MPDLDRLSREGLATFLTTANFRVFFQAAFGPELQKWRRRLLTDTAMTEGERLGLQQALLAMQAGIQACFEKVELEIPLWLKKELGLNEYD